MLKREIHRVFLEADADGSGYLDNTELATCLKLLGIDAEKKSKQALLNEIDADGNGFVTLDEFMEFALTLG